MRKKWTIIIRTPLLRKIRDNLRDLWVAWARSQYDDLFNKRRTLERNEDGKLKNLDGFNQEERKKIEELGGKISLLRDIENDSICICTVCGKEHRDMTYNPVDKSWYCVECYHENQEFYKDTKESFLYP